MVCAPSWIALLDRDPWQDAVFLGFDLLGHLVGVHLVQRLAVTDWVAFSLSHLTMVAASML